MMFRNAIALLALLLGGASLLTAASGTDASSSTVANIVILGDSLTEGYGLGPGEKSYPAQLEGFLNEDGFNVKVINAGVAGDTAGEGLQRLDPLLAQPFDVFLIELGANDLGQHRSLEEAEANLRTIIHKVREANPHAKIGLLGIVFPSWFGDRPDEFTALYPRVAKAEGVALCPSLLENVVGVAALNQADGIHPTEEGAGIVAHNIEEFVKNLLPQSAGQEVISK